MKVYSYIVAHDNGFAPNPFHGVCSLACCKPRIRAAAEVGDILVGLSRGCESIIYTMRVDEVVGFDEYWSRPEFSAKRASPGGLLERVGDNIYQPLSGGYRQTPSLHSNHDGTEHAGNKQRDLSSLNVLLSRQFAYFGAESPPLPTNLAFLRVGRGHRCRFSGSEVRSVRAWFSGLPMGLVGRPSGWPEEDEGGAHGPACARPSD